MLWSLSLVSSLDACGLSFSFILIWSTSTSWRLLTSGCGRASSAEYITKGSRCIGVMLIKIEMNVSGFSWKGRDSLSPLLVEYLRYSLCIWAYVSNRVLSLLLHCTAIMLWEYKWRETMICLQHLNCSGSSVWTVWSGRQFQSLSVQ